MPSDPLRHQSDSHPHVAHHIAALSNARRDAEAIPYPYAEGTKVIVETPTGDRYDGWVLRCDPEEWLDIQVIDLPDYFSDTPCAVMTFFPASWPERIEDGVMVFNSAFRTRKEAKTVAP